MQTIEAFVSHGSAMLAGVAALMLDILAKLHCGGDGSSEDVAPTSLLLLGPPGGYVALQAVDSCAPSAWRVQDKLMHIDSGFNPRNQGLGLSPESGLLKSKCSKCKYDLGRHFYIARFNPSSRPSICTVKFGQLKSST